MALVTTIFLSIFVKVENIKVAITPNVSTQSVSEYTIALMLNLSRKITTNDKIMKDLQWQRNQGENISSKTIALLGLGKTGLKTAEKCKIAFSMQTIGFTKTQYLNQSFPYIDKITDSLEDCLKVADFISIHLNLNETTHYLINKKTLNFCKSSAYLINTARGKIINEIDLFYALKTNQIRGAALDVFEQEPYIPQSKETDLRLLDNIILSPHTASHTAETNQKTAEIIIQNIQNFYANNFNDLTTIF